MSLLFVISGKYDCVLHNHVSVPVQFSLQNGRVPGALFCGNGGEFTSRILDLWAYYNTVKIEFGQPGKPTDDALIEPFDGLVSE